MPLIPKRTIPDWGSRLSFLPQYLFSIVQDEEVPLGSSKDGFDVTLKIILNYCYFFILHNCYRNTKTVLPDDYLPNDKLKRTIYFAALSKGCLQRCYQLVQFISIRAAYGIDGNKYCQFYYIF